MKTQVRYGLRGAFKVDLYSGDKFVSTTDWFSNFITQTGLRYPWNYNFVDCFRFLSIGKGSVPNSGWHDQNPAHPPTTGLNSPIVTYQTSAGNQSGIYIGYPGYELGSTQANISSPCLTTMSETGPRFFRSWSIPTGDVGVTVQEPAGFLGIQEFMVSPSSGSDPAGRYAFSRVVRNLTIPNGYRAIISYQLAVDFVTGLTLFTGGTFQTGNANVDNDANLVATWANLSGYYRQVGYSLTSIDTNGAPYIPSFGQGMEPSLANLNRYVFYLSPDNSQFDVNNTVGGPQNDIYGAYSSDGVMQFLDDINLLPPEADGMLNNPDNFFSYYYGGPSYISAVPVSVPQNIRLGNATNYVNIPEVSNYSGMNDDISTDYNYQVNVTGANQPISFATMGALGIDPNKRITNQNAAFSSRIFRLPPSGNVQARTLTVTRKTIFPPSVALGYNSRFGSLVFAYNTNSALKTPNLMLSPIWDCLFYDSSGRSLMQHYRYIPTLYFSERGSGVVDAKVSINRTVGDNVTRWVNLQTFQGPYNSASGFDYTHPAIYGGITLSDGSTFGKLCSGTINPNVYGNVSWNLDGGSGFGAVYGAIGNENFVTQPVDVGLADHTTGIKTPPAVTGQLYWPYCLRGNEINVMVSGVKFFDTGANLHISDTGNWFVSGNQIVSTIAFDFRTNSCVSTPHSNFVGYPTGFAGGAIGTEIGYFLTVNRYTGQSLGSTDISKFIVAGMGGNATGFMDSAGVASCGVATSIPTNYQTSLKTGLRTISTLNGFGVTNGITVTGFFTGITDRGYNSKWNSLDGGNGFRVNSNAPYEYFTSGNMGWGTTVSGVYLTYVWNNGVNNFANSYLSPVVQLTNLASPVASCYHVEALNGNTGCRLLPNHGIANNTGQDYYVPKVGGQYPALSRDNTLELYFNIQWFSPCGTNTQNCSDTDV